MNRMTMLLILVVSVVVVFLVDLGDAKCCDTVYTGIGNGRKRRDLLSDMLDDDQIEFSDGAERSERKRFDTSYLKGFSCKDGWRPPLGQCCGKGRCNIFCCNCDGGCRGE